jgi:VanZ family protein
LLLAGILPLSLLPMDDFSTALSLNDKVLHMLAYTALMLWFAGIVPQRRYYQLALALLAYGMIIELLQSLTVYRSMELADLFADAGGLVLGWILAKLGLWRWCEWLEHRVLIK